MWMDRKMNGWMEKGGRKDQDMERGVGLGVGDR